MALISVLCILTVGLGALTDSIDKVITFSEKNIAPLFAEKEFYFEHYKDRVTYAGGDGTSTKAAVVILGAESTDAGIGAERFWIAKKYPDYRHFHQASFTEIPRKVTVNIFGSDGKDQSDFEVEAPINSLRRYDVISIQKEGTVREIHFDISDFYGKPILDPLVQKVIEGLENYKIEEKN